MPKLAKLTGYEAEIRYFADMIDGKVDKSVLTARDARDAIALLECERRSAVRGTWVKC